MKLGYKISFTIIMILLVITTSVGRSYALWTITEKQTNPNLVETGCLDIAYNDLTEEGLTSSIYLENTFPIDDETGKKLVPYKVTIENKCTLAANYNIYLGSFVSNDLPEKNLKIYFSRIDDNTYWGPQLISSLEIVNTNASVKKKIEEETNEQIKNSYVLASGILNPTETKTYELRMWVSEDSNNEVMKKTFKSIVYMEAVATENHL